MTVVSVGQERLAREACSSSSDADAHHPAATVLLAGRQVAMLLLAALVCGWCLCAVGRRRPVHPLLFLKNMWALP
jgi:hypothetical protein